MAGTVVAFGDPKAQKKWGTTLFLDTVKKSYFERKFIGESENSVIQRLTDLEQDAGDTISFDLSVQLRNKPTYGDARLEGKEENLKFYSDEVYIDQIRHAVSAGGKMSRKRTAHNLRTIGKERLSDYFAKLFDETIFIYLAGGRGINEDFYEDVTWTGHAGNAIEAPDAAHIVYGGDATAKNDLDSADKMTKNIIEKSEVKARMMRSTDPTTANMMPIMINGESHYVTVMTPFQSHDLRTADTTGWIEINKALITAEGKASPIFKGGLGMIKNVVLHDHESVIRFSDYGSGADQPAARALFMGRQAGVMAWGSAKETRSAKGMASRYSWSEKTVDHGNEPIVAAGSIVGMKKSRFNDKDFGVISIDTYAKDPNAA